MRYIAVWNVLLLVTAVILLVPLCGCDQKGEFNPIKSSLLDTPVVNGFWVYNAAGELIGSWGKPDFRDTNENPSAPQTSFNSRAYPNPVQLMSTTPIGFTISFALPESMKVWIWVVRARGPEEIEARFERAAGADYVVPSNVPTIVLLTDSTLGSGMHEVDWNFSSDDVGRTLQIGFYRLFLYAEGPTTSLSSHHDLMLLLGSDCRLAPPDLRPYLRCDY